LVAPDDGPATGTAVKRGHQTTTDSQAPLPSLLRMFQYRAQMTSRSIGGVQDGAWAADGSSACIRDASAEDGAVPPAPCLGLSSRHLPSWRFGSPATYQHVLRRFAGRPLGLCAGRPGGHLSTARAHQAVPLAA